MPACCTSIWHKCIPKFFIYGTFLRRLSISSSQELCRSCFMLSLQPLGSPRCNRDQKLGSQPPPKEEIRTAERPLTPRTPPRSRRWTRERPKEALTSRASHMPAAITTTYHGIAPPTTRSGAALDGLGTHGSADGSLRQRHLVGGVFRSGGVSVVTTSI